MSKKRHVLFAGLLLAGTAAAQQPDHVPGRLLVRHKPQADGATLNRVFARYGARIHRKLDTLGVTVLSVPEESSGGVIASFRNSGLFHFVERDYYAKAAGVPNDPYYGSEWHLTRLQAPTAWNTATGGGVIIAVLDSGVDSTHPDLAGKVLPGWSYISGNTNTADLYGHGTAVAGSVAAATNNGIGVAGVAANSQILPVVVANSSGSASYSNLAAGIQYAADHGARIINVSLGGTASSYTLQNAIDYAWNKGAVVFASASNSGNSTPSYPAACNHAVAVSATDSNDALASYSNYGSWITLSAPGTGILTTNNGGGYAYWSGTSFSSPVAAGVGALALSANSSLSAAALVALLEQSSDDLGASGFDPSYGYGRVNAARAVAAAAGSSAPAPAPAPAPPPVSGSSIFVNCGGPAYTDPSGQVWIADPGFTGAGGSYSTTAPVSGASAQGVYQSEVYGDVAYQFMVPNGGYTVTLKFAELTLSGAGQRLMNVFINGQAVLANFDIAGQAGGPRIAVDRQFSVNVTGGTIEIRTQGVVYGATLNGLQIVPANSQTPAPAPAPASAVRVNCGGSAYTDASGQVWSADPGFTGSGGSYTAVVPIAGATSAPLYQSEVYGDVIYTLPVSNGTRTVTLKFAELTLSAPGQRTFNVYINGQLALSNFDIVAQAGGARTAVDKQFTVTVSTGVVSIRLQGQTYGATLSAIQIQ